MRKIGVFLFFLSIISGTCYSQLEDSITICQSDLSLSKNNPELILPVIQNQGKHSSFLQIEAVEVKNQKLNPVVFKVFIDMMGKNPIEIGSYSFYPVDQPEKFYVDLKERFNKNEFQIRLQLQNLDALDNDVHLKFKKAVWLK